MTYATIEDLEAVYKPLDSQEQEKALALLDYASVAIRRAYKEYDQPYGTTSDDDKARKIVCCNIVRRIMSSENYADLTNASTTVGSFTESWTYSNPDGSLFLRNSDYKLLGLSKGKAISVGV